MQIMENYDSHILTIKYDTQWRNKDFYSGEISIPIYVMIKLQETTTCKGVGIKNFKRIAKKNFKISKYGRTFLAQ